MDSYQHQQPPFFVGLPQNQYPPTPNSTEDEFPPIPLYDSNAFPSTYGPSIEIDANTTIPTAASAHSPAQDHIGNFVNMRGVRGSSEEQELTPGQRRRKEQNRAAQRAFRERKERHVKELEIKLASLEKANSITVIENVDLKAELEKTRLENKLLHENTMRGHSPPQIPDLNPMNFKPLEPIEPLSSSTSSNMDSPPPDRFTSPIFGKHPNSGPIHRITTSPNTGEKLLGAGAAWDLIVCHPLYQQGLVDIGDISDRLKSLARCDGQGPVFEECVILDAIQASAGSGRDDLLVFDDNMDF